MHLRKTIYMVFDFNRPFGKTSANIDTSTHALDCFGPSPPKKHETPRGTRHRFMQTNVLRAGTPWLRHQSNSKWLVQDSGPQMGLHLVWKMEVHDLWLLSSPNVISVPISSVHFRDLRFGRFSGAFSIQLLQSPACECHGRETHLTQCRYFVWPGAEPNPQMHPCYISPCVILINIWLKHTSNVKIFQAPLTIYYYPSILSILKHPFNFLCFCHAIQAAS